MVLWLRFLSMKRSTTSKRVVSNGVFKGEIDWELRPGGMLVQKRNAGDAASGPMIKIKVSYGSYHHDITILSQATFGNHLHFSAFLVLFVLKFYGKIGSLSFLLRGVCSV